MSDDLPAVLALVRQHRADAHAEDVLTGHTRLNAAAAGFRRLLEDPGHRVVLAVLPGPERRPRPAPPARWPSGSPSSASTRCRWCSGNPQVTVDTFVVHREHRRRGAGVAAAGGGGRPTREETGAAYVVAAVGGHEAERQRFFARMGFAPLTTRRIVARRVARRGRWPPGSARGRAGAALPRRAAGRDCRRRAPVVRGLLRLRLLRPAAIMQVSRPLAVGRPGSSVTWMRKVARRAPAAHRRADRRHDARTSPPRR